MVHSSYKLRRAIASVLLLFYGTVGVLGYGLHDLFHVHHGHAHSGETACCCSNSECGTDTDCCTSHEDCSSDARHSHETCEDSHIVVEDSHIVVEGSHIVVAYRQNEQPSDFLVATEHECAICSFLTQAQEVAAEADSAELVGAVSFGPPASEVLFPLYLPSEHLARGPPCC